MVRRKLSLGLAAASAISMALLATSTADAFWGSRGSWGSSGGSWGSSGGSSGGSWGSSGGSWGSHGSSGGSWGRRYYRSYHSSGGSWGSSGGSWGSHGSSGGSYGSYGSSGGSSGGSYGSSGGSSGGSYGSSGGSYGSSGGVIIQQPSYSAPAPAADDSTSANSTSVYFTVSVPADAKVMINGKETTTTGASRTYVSRGLEAGRQYKYDIRAEAVRDGKTVSDTQTVTVRAGDRQNLSFALNEQATDEQVVEEADENEAPKTTLKLRVPDEADVSLSGHETTSKGRLRVFTTTQLGAGETWDNYVIHAEVERNGERLSKEVVISLTAGETREVAIGFSNEKLAGLAR